MTLDFNAAVLVPIIASAALAVVTYRINRGQDRREARLDTLERKFADFQLAVATEYIRTPEIDALKAEVKADIEELRADFKAFRAEFHTLAGAVNRLIGRLDKA